MVRKTVFTRHDVVAAGVRVVAQGGLDALSARHIARELGSSTAPVYSNFSTMEDLAAAVKQAVADDLLAFTSRDFSANQFLNIGLGVLEFARLKPTLYAAVFGHGRAGREVGRRVMSRLSERMALVAELRDLPAGERLLLLHEMGIFTHGLAVQICSGLADEFTFTDLACFLEDAGEGLMRHALSRSGCSAAQQELMASLLAFNAKDEEDHGKD